METYHYMIANLYNNMVTLLNDPESYIGYVGTGEDTPNRAINQLLKMDGVVFKKVNKEKLCLYCGKILNTEPLNIKNCNNGNNKNRKYCSEECGIRYRSRPKE